MPPPYEYITETNGRDKVISDIHYTSIIGVDTETTSLNPRTGTLLTIQVATPDVTYVCNATKVDLTPLYFALLEFDGYTIIQNAKFDLQYLFSNFGLT